jgi:polyribonucleotide nucleotidyltransferase
MVKVKVLETDEKGRVKLSLKALTERPAGMEFQERAPREDRGGERRERPDRGERNDRGDRGDRAPRGERAPRFDNGNSGGNSGGNERGGEQQQAPQQPQPQHALYPEQAQVELQRPAPQDFPRGDRNDPQS